MRSVATLSSPQGYWVAIWATGHTFRCSDAPFYPFFSEQAVFQLSRLSFSVLCAPLPKLDLLLTLPGTASPTPSHLAADAHGNGANPSGITVWAVYCINRNLGRPKVVYSKFVWPKKKVKVTCLPFFGPIDKVRERIKKKLLWRSKLLQLARNLGNRKQGKSSLLPFSVLPKFRSVRYPTVRTRARAPPKAFCAV